MNLEVIVKGSKSELCRIVHLMCDELGVSCKNNSASVNFLFPPCRTKPEAVDVTFAGESLHLLTA